LFIEIIEGGNHRKTTDKLWNKSIFNQVIGFHFFKDLGGGFLIIFLFNFCSKADAAFALTLLDHFFKACERTATDKENVAGIHIDKLSIWVLTPARWRHGCYRTF